MKYIVEIACIRRKSAAEVVHRFKIHEESASRARAKAQMILGAWRNHGAKFARVLNSHDKQLYCLKWTSQMPRPNDQNSASREILNL